MFKQLATIFLALLWAVTIPAQAQEFSAAEERMLGAYLAYYGRPADPAGLAFWADRLETEGGDLSSVIDAFAESQEFQDRFGNLSNTELVTNLYDQLFGREPDTAGLDFYVAELESGASTLQDISIVILDGVQGDDVTIVSNRLGFSEYYVTNADADGIADLSGDSLAQLTASIDASDESLTEAISVARGDSNRAAIVLSGDAEVPAVSTSAAGWGSMTLDLASGALTGSVTVTGVEVTAAHIHKAFAGISGDVSISLSQGSDASQWVVPDDTTLSAEEMTSFSSGEFYVNVHSETNPAGEIRGQLLTDSISVIWSTLSGDNENPAVASAASGRAALTLNSEDMSVVLHATTSDLDDSSAAHIHQGFAGVNGGVVVGLEQDANDSNHWLLSNTVLDSDVYAALWAGELYVNVHSATNAGGELRGQLLPDNISVIWSALSGDNENPAVTSAASGRAALTLNSNDMSVVLHATTSDLDDASAAHIHQGFAGINGGVLVGLVQDVDDANHWELSSTVLDSDAYAALWAGELYVNVHTSANPGGELRGQLEP